MIDATSQSMITKNEVVITDIKMPFWSMVVFMVKWAIAAIPAFIILSIMVAVVAGIITGMVST